MLIIAVSGKAFSGKDTVGEYLVKNYGFIRVASADALKRIARNIFGWNGVKDENGRRFLQALGCAVRDYNQDFWIDLALAEIRIQSRHDLKRNFVVTDVRFENEVKKLKAEGAMLLRLERAGVTRFDHISETELDGYTGFDHIVENNDSFEKLYSRVDEIIRPTIAERILP